jgi:cytochrome c2
MSVVALLLLAAGLLALSFIPMASRGAAVAVAPMVATATVAPTPTPPLVEVGRTLFSIKGCPSCHRHDGLTGARMTEDGQVVPAGLWMVGVDGAPDLTNYDPDPAFVRTWLKDPQALRPGTQMPNLRLKEEEIEALLAFLEE